jgi:hypothetical protein
MQAVVVGVTQVLPTVVVVVAVAENVLARCQSLALLIQAAVVVGVGLVETQDHTLVLMAVVV